MPQSRPRIAPFPPVLRAVAVALAAALLALLPGTAAAAQMKFDPKAFFSGHTEGIGRLKIIFHSSEDVRVEGTGRIQADGTLELSQVVRKSEDRASSRVWRIHEITPGRYTGTLTDAKGPVSGEVAGNLLHFVYTSLDGYGYEQWITLAADGRSAHNILKVRKLGLTVATLDETIRKID